MMKSIIFFASIFFEVKTILYLSMSIEEVIDCINIIYNEENEVLYQNNITIPDCITNKHYPDILFKTPYEYGQKIYIEFFAQGFNGYFKMTVNLNEYTIKTGHNKFWTCLNCLGENNNYIFNSDENLYFYENEQSSDLTYHNFTFFFQINYTSELEYPNNIVNDTFYAFTSQINFYIIIDNLNNEINLINFNTTDNFYIKDNPTLQTPYDEKGYQIIFDNSVSGQFKGLENSGSNILNNGSFFRVSKYEGLRYKLSDNDKNNHGVVLRIRLRAYSSYISSSKPVSQEQEFNFYICLNGYLFCDKDTSLKCLNNGYFYDLKNDKCFSCSETCNTCNYYKKSNNSEIQTDYCNNCDNNYIYTMTIEKNDNNNIISYLNCNKCQQYIKNDDYTCIDNCYIDNYKYLLYNRRVCYDVIPNNYYMFINDYSQVYPDASDYPIININKECPNNYLSNKICIKSLEDIFYLISPKELLIKFNNLVILYMHQKTIIMRAHYSNSTAKEIYSNTGEEIASTLILNY